MYDERDFNNAQRATRNALLLMFLPAILLLGGAVWSFIARIKWLTILLCSLTGCWMIFIHQMAVVPRQAYREHIRSARGKSLKQTEGRFTRAEATPVERSNVMFYAFYLNVGDKQDPEDDRLFYFDALKPLPHWQPGDRVRVTSYDKFVSSYQKLAGADEPAPAV